MEAVAVDPNLWTFLGQIFAPSGAVVLVIRHMLSGSRNTIKEIDAKVTAGFASVGEQVTALDRRVEGLDDRVERLERDLGVYQR